MGEYVVLVVVEFEVFDVCWVYVVGEAPLSPVELIAKARMLMSYGGVHEVDRLIDAILALSDDSALPTLPELPVFLAVQQNNGG